MDGTESETDVEGRVGREGTKCRGSGDEGVSAH